MDYKTKKKERKFKNLKNRDELDKSAEELEVIQKKVKPNKVDEKGQIPILESAIQRMKDVKNNLKVDNMDIFLNDKERHECPVCHRLRKFYCHDCLVPTMYPEHVPKIDLPLSLVIIHHESEKRAKSSALPLKLVSPSQIEVLDSANIKGDEFDVETTLILYPHPTAIEVKELTEETLTKSKSIVAIDCTWFQTAGILNKLKQTNYRFVKISDYDTTFWRHQEQSSKHLATCEAIYYFYKEFDEQYEKVVKKNEGYVYEGKYDNLLFYYLLQYLMIEREYLNKPKE